MKFPAISAVPVQVSSMFNYWYKVRLADGRTGWSYGAFFDITYVIGGS